jgi:hypothetical protein
VLSAAPWVVVKRGDDPIGAKYHPSAAELREQAYAACDAHLWHESEQKLDAAQKVDPKGEAEPPVVAARKSVREASDH